MSSSSEAGTSPKLEEVIASYEIAQFKARYWRLMDTRQWDEWIECFLPDAIFDVSGEPDAFAAAGRERPSEDYNLVWRGRDEIRSTVSAAYVGVKSCHHGHVHEFEYISSSSANAIWEMEDILVHGPNSGYRGYGYYHDSYVKVDGRWFIEKTKLVRLFVLPFQG
jgi:SnoaL-like domain